jgi:group I intron endonuclease
MWSPEDSRNEALLALPWNLRQEPVPSTRSTMTGCIYIATCRTTGKSYVGKTVRRFVYRKRAHEREAATGSPKKFHRAIRKYGFDDFNWEVRDVAIEALDTTEIALILELNTFNNGYNSTTGGDGGYEHDQETRQKISLANLGYKHTPESRLKRSLALAGRPHSPEHTAKVADTIRGKRRTPEQRQHISEAHKGQRHSVETRRKISDALRRRIVKPETRQKLSDANRGRAHTPEACRKISLVQQGRKASSETRKRMSESHRIRQQQMSSQEKSEIKKRAWVTRRGGET